MKLFTLIPCFVTAIITFMFSCTSDNESAFQESPDTSNSLSQLGISGDIYWDDIKDIKEFENAHPWSDTYWPLYTKGMAERWLDITKGITGVYDSQPPTLYKQLIQMRYAVKANQASGNKTDKNILHRLSPAEKYDFLINPQITVSSELEESLKQSEIEFQMTFNERVVQLMNSIKDTQFKFLRFNQREAMLFEQLEKQNEILAQAIVNNESDESIAIIEQAIDELEEKIDIIFVETSALYTSMELMKSEYQELTKDFYKQSRFYADQLKDDLPMVAESWSDWSYYQSSYDHSWEWMGHCHGWAPASIMEEKPKHGVMVHKNGVEVFFSEGDIRGLLTKIWAEQAPKTDYFAGKRCRSQDLPTNHRGRILDGLICYGNHDTCNKSIADSYIWIKKNYLQLNSGSLYFTESIHGKSSKVGVVKRRIKEDYYQMDIYASLEDYTAMLDDKDHSPPALATLHVTAGCRDINPMTLHTALTHVVAKGKSVVMDVTRSSQVWNQPVYKFELEQLPVRKSRMDGIVYSEPGELVAIEDIKDPFRIYRASETAYVAEYKATIFFGVENGPYLEYDKSKELKDDKNSTLDLKYTLEFDSSKKLIGGEWGSIPQPGSENAVDYNPYISGDDIPDFIWYFKDGATLEDGAYDIRLIKAIHNCSLQPLSTNPKTITMESIDMKSGIKSEKQLAYTDCHLN